jgi:hypothetical protein
MSEYSAAYKQHAYVISTEHFTQTQDNVVFPPPLTEPVFEIDHILGHNTSLNRYKKIEINPSILLYHHGLKLDFNNNKNNRNNRKPTNSLKLNNSLLNDYWVKKERKKERKTF